MIKKIKSSTFSFIKEYYSILLLLLLLLFIFRPTLQDVLYFAVWKLVLACTFISVVFKTQFPKKIKVIASLFAIPAVFFDWVSLWQTSEIFYILNVFFTLVFILICTIAILYHAFVITRFISIDTLKAVICAYFMVAFFFAYSFYLLEVLHPDSFNLSETELSDPAFYISKMLYFSFTTLLTIGYGDITPITDVGQTLAVMEGIVGQFYLAILVARLIVIYSPITRKAK